jgi:hypothetical protein
MRKFVMLVAALGLVAAACGGGDDAGSCEGVADDAIEVIQEFINEVDELSLEEAAELGADSAIVSDMETKADELQDQANSLGCSDAEMEALFTERLDDLTAEGMIGELMLEGIRSEGLFD